MKFNQLTDLKTNKPRKRKARGIAAGSGKTAGRGTKGQNSRSGGGVRPHFEGGQTPLVRLLPKLAGFKSHRPKADIIYTGELDGIKTNSKVIDNYVLAQAGLVKDAFSRVKLIKKGEIKQAHSLQVQAISAAAKDDLLKAKGDFKKVSRFRKPVSEKKKARSDARKAVAGKENHPPKS